MATVDRTQPRPYPLVKPRFAMHTPSRWRCLWPALLSGGLLWLCYFPADCGWLAWAALVPLLCLVRTDAPARRVYLAAWAGGLLFFLVSLQWLRVADHRMYATWLGLTLYCSLFFPAALWLLRRLDRRTPLPLALTVPIVWTALEFVRAHFLTGFAWYFLGHTQHDVLALIQVADLGGAYAVTFLVAAVNAVLFEFLFRKSWFRTFFALPKPSRPRPLVLPAAAIGVLLIASVVYGFARLGQEDFAPGPRVALIQGNLDQRIRNLAAQHKDPAQAMWRHYQELHREAAGQKPPPDLIVWPETSYLYDWIAFAPDFPAERLPEQWRHYKQGDDEQPVAELPNWRHWLSMALNAEALRMVPPGPTHVLLGLNAERWTGEKRNRRYNSAVLLRADPTRPFLGRYDKIHRVPFGEYVPFREELPWMNALAPYEYDYSIHAGEEFTRFPLGDYRFGVLICYEDTDPALARQYVAPGTEQVDFLVNISNDGWFDGTSEHEEHLAICRFRAVEARRSVVRAVNMGVSAVIDGSGRVVNLPGASWSASKKVSAVLTAVVPLDRRSSWYAAWGDWLALGCWAVVGLAVLASVVLLVRSALVLRP